MSSGVTSAPPPLSGLTLAIAAVALATGTFMQVLDSTIANVSMPTIAGHLGASTHDGTWVITAFAAANGVTVPLTGWLMGRFGVVRTFVLSVLLFTAASLMCGMAWSLPVLVFFRLLQGAVSGPMIPGSQALLIMIFPPKDRALAIGVWSITTLVGPITGPILGGYISDNAYWGLIFLINVPVGLMCAGFSWFMMKGRETPTHKAPVDTVGLGLLAIWVGSLQCVLDLGENDDWFNSPAIVILAVVAAVAFVAWLIWELTDKHPIVDLCLFRHRNFSISVAALSLGYALFFGTSVLLPLWLQQEMGYTATWAGLVAAPSGVTAIVTALIVTRVMGAGRIDVRIFASASFLVFAVSYFMRAAYTSYADFFHLMAPMLVQGVAINLFFMSMTEIGLDGIPPARIPSATGITNFARITSGSFAASLTTMIWDRRESLHQTRLAESSSPFSPSFVQGTGALHGAGLTAQQAAGAVARQMVGQAYLLSSTEIFWFCGWVSLATVAVIWLARRPAAAGALAASAD